MGTVLISKKGIRLNKAVKSIQKEYIKQHKGIKGKFPKGKLGKVVCLGNNNCIDCTESSEGIEAQGQIQNAIEKIAQLSIQEIWELIKEAEPVGMGGAGFSTVKKLETIKKVIGDQKILIINGIACDPGLLHDAWLMEHYSEEIKLGIEIINKLIRFDKTILATPSMVPCRYPMGEERILIKTLLGVEIKDNEIPAEKGILVLNVQTVLSIYKAVIKNEQEKKRYITVADIGTGNAVIAKVNMGQNLEQVINKLLEANKHTAFLTNTKECYVGSGIMDAAPLEKMKDQSISAGTGLICFGKAFEFHNEAKCKGCGACTHKCPKGIKVHKVVQAMEKGDWSKLDMYPIEACIKCGSCSYYCKAGKNIIEIMTAIMEEKYER